jgi:hypothetical protein
LLDDERIRIREAQELKDPKHWLEGTGTKNMNKAPEILNRTLKEE